MRTISLFILAAVAAPPGVAEPMQLASGSARSNDYKIRYETRLEPDGDRTAVKGLGGGFRTKDGRFYRIVKLRSKKIYFGYEVTVEAQAENRYAVEFSPLTREAAGLSAKEEAEWSAAPLPGYPERATVENGAVIAVDLVENPQTGQKIIDYLTIGSDALRSETVEGPARDFTVEDAWIQIIQPLVTVDGEVIEPTRNFRGGISGAVAWIYTPSHGRYLLSLAPRAERGFELAGEIRSATMTIETGGSRIELNCSERIAKGKQAYNLYVLHQPAFRPAMNEKARFLMGAASDVRSLLE